MIRFEQVSVQYEGAARPTLSGVDLTVPEGELVLLVGPSGVGKSTLLGAVSGLVPHFTGGTLRGRVMVDGRDTRTHKPRELADLVGTVGQDPLSHFVTDTVEDELAYGMESLGLAPDVMRRRVEETLDLLGLAGLRDRPIATLSGGQQQRVAIAVALANNPSVLLADEPTGELDSATGEQVFAAFRRANEELGTTIVIVTHDQAVAGEVRRTVAIRDGRTSSEVLRRTEVDAATGQESQVAREYAMLDRAGRLQLPAEYTETLGMEHRVMLELEQDHIGVWPDDQQRG